MEVVVLVESVKDKLQIKAVVRYAYRNNCMGFGTLHDEERFRCSAHGSAAWGAGSKLGIPQRAETREGGVKP